MRRKIIGVTVGTSISPEALKRKMNISSSNGNTVPDCVITSDINPNAGSGYNFTVASGSLMNVWEKVHNGEKPRVLLKFLTCGGLDSDNYIAEAHSVEHYASGGTPSWLCISFVVNDGLFAFESISPDRITGNVITSYTVTKLGGGLPEYSKADNGKVLGIVNGSPAWVEATVGGDTPEIPDVPDVPDVPVSHGIVWDLVNVTSSNSVVTVNDGASLVAVLTAVDGYTLGDVTVTMGGEVVTGAWNADTATVTIARVTGDVMISCAGVEQVTAEPVDTSPVIAQTGYAYRCVSTTNPNTVLTAKTGMCVTKIYEFTPNVAAIEAHPNYDADLGYINAANRFCMFAHYIPNAKFLEGGGTDPGTTYKKAAYFVDGVLQTAVYENTNSTSAPGVSPSGLAKNVLQKTVNGIAFTLFEADAEYSYAYWTKTHANGTYFEDAVLPVGVNDGDIIFAGKYTEYYGMTNIYGTTAGNGASTATELSFDDDMAQNYAVATTSVLGDEPAADAKTKYGISDALAEVITTAKKEWMAEYGGDYRKIPIIVSTDQHGRTNAGIFNLIGKTFSMHDVSKVINLGDTVSEWSDSDAEHPLLSNSGLENWCKSVQAIPFSKQLNVYGNHDTWYGNYSDEGNPIGTRYPSGQAHLNQYFRNIYARRTNNNGWFVVHDDQFNVKYVVVSAFEYQGTVAYRIGTEQMKFIIDELKKDDGYDVVIISHVPLLDDPTQNTYPTDAGTNSGTAFRVSALNTDAMFSARKTKGSGTITDSDGVEHSYDFTDCKTEVLCSLHGHTHYDAYLHLNGSLLVNSFDWFDDDTIFLALIDRVDRVLNVWKVEGDTLTSTNYQIPLDKPAE